MNVQSGLTKGDLRKGRGCLTVFGAAFFVPGIAVLVYAGWIVTRHFEARDWAPVDATVLAADLDVNHDSDGGTTYRVTGRYRYSWNGQTFESDRIAFSKGSDNIGDFHQTTYDLLRRHATSGEPLTVWVDPDAPSQAVAIRALRPGMLALTTIFGVLFAGVGAGIILMGHVGAKIAARESDRQARHPEQPWLWKDEWQSRTLTSSNRRSFYATLGFAAVWNLISAPLLIVLPGEILDKQNYLALIGALFPLVGVVLIAMAVRSWRRLQRFGQSELELDEMPLAPGGRLEATLRSPGDLPAGTTLQVVISGIRKRRTGSGKNRSTRETVFWQDEQQLSLASGTGHGGLRQRVRFTLPPDAKASDWSDPDDQILWRLSAEAENPGVDYSASFELPVFGPPVSGADARLREEPPPGADRGDWQRTGVIRSTGLDGERFEFPAGRHRMLGIGVAAGALIFGGVGIAIFASGSPIFGGVFTLIGAVLLLSALHTLTHRSVVTVRGGTIRLRSGWLWLGPEKRIDAGDIAEFDQASSLTVGNKRYYDIVVATTDGQKTKLANSLAGKRDTARLIDEFRSLTGLGLR